MRRREATATRVYAFHCGGDYSGIGVYDPLEQDASRIVYGPYFFFLIEHPEGRLLFDSGMHPKWKGSRRRDDGTGIEVGERDDVVSRLALLGVEPDEVAHVVMSHLHYDHAGGLQFFPRARVYVQEAELRFAYWPAVYQRELYDRDDFDHRLTWRELEGPHDVFGDGAVCVLPTPGHTPGHQSLCVELPSGLLVLAADASYLEVKMRQRRLPGVVWNPDAMVQSWRALEELERARGARLVFTHDLDFRESKPLAPESWYE
jgi:glyoxylase-like metal-dependent hydrolase (beta-lactamase superfamily II)